MHASWVASRGRRRSATVSACAPPGHQARLLKDSRNRLTGKGQTGRDKTYRFYQVKKAWVAWSLGSLLRRVHDGRMASIWRKASEAPACCSDSHLTGFTVVLIGVAFSLVIRAGQQSPRSSAGGRAKLTRRTSAPTQSLSRPQCSFTLIAADMCHNAG